MCQGRELFGCRHADTQTQTQNLPEEGTCWLQTCRYKLIICREGRHFPEDMQTRRHKLRICQRRNFFYYRHVDTNSQSARERNFLAVDTKTQTQNLPEKATLLLQTCRYVDKNSCCLKLKICQRREIFHSRHKLKICQRRRLS